MLNIKHILRKPGWFITLIIIPILLFLLKKQYDRLTEEKTGKLLIKCNIDSAQVFVNGDFYAWTIADKLISIGKFPGGIYSLDVIKSGYEEFTDQQVQIRKDEPVTVPVNLILDPKSKLQREWLGEPFNPNKINILVADFTDINGNVDEMGKKWATRTHNKLRALLYEDEKLKQVVEVKRLYSAATGERVIREELHAREVGERMNADVVIWGQNMCTKDSICYMAYANFSHEERTMSSFIEGVMHRAHILRADLPTLIGAETECLVQFIIGWTYLNDNQYKQYAQAMKYLEKALYSIEKDNCTEILLWSCIAALYAGQYELGEQYYVELKSIQKRKNDLVGLAYTYNIIGAIYEKKSDWDKALEYYQKSEAISIEVGDTAFLATIYNNMGVIYYNKGDWNKALDYYLKDESISIEFGDRAGLSTSYNNIGLIYFKKGDWDKALEYYQKSEAISIEIGDRAGLSTTYNNIGLIYSNKSDWDKAMEYFKKSEAISIKIGDRAGPAATYNNIGAIYDKKGDWDKALEYFKKSEAISIKIGERAGLATTYNYIGRIYSNKGDWDKALEYFQISEAIQIKVGDRDGIAKTYNNMGALFRKKGKLKKALDFCNKSLQLTLKLKDLINEKAARYQIAQILSSMKKYDEAVPHLEQCVEIDQQLNHPDLNTDLQELLIMQLRAFSETGKQYRLLKEHLSKMTDSEKVELFKDMEENNVVK